MSNFSTLEYMISSPLEKDIPKKATRDGYGDGLVKAGENNDKIVVLDADLSGSTRTNKFSKAFPKRFFNFGVAEQNLIGQAAGLALSGLTPVASSFAIFATGRAWEIVRNSVAYPKLNVKIAASHAGITLGEDGASHQIIEDMAIMRAIPSMSVIVPADYWQAYKAIEAATSTKGPMYIRLGRPPLPMMYGPSDKFEIGKGHVIQEGKEVAFISCGVMVYEAWKSAVELEKKKRIKPYVINMSTVKPLDEKLIDSIISDVDTIFTFEEHNILGGMGSAVAEYVGGVQPKKVIRIGIDDKFGQSGTVSDLMKEYCLDSDSLTNRVIKELG